MAIKHSQELQLKQVEPLHFLVAAIEAAKEQGWDVHFISTTGFIAYTPFSMSSWSEEVVLKIEDQKARVESSCTSFQLIDWGKNKRNVNAFVAAMAQKQEKLTAEEIETKVEALQPHFANQEVNNLNQAPANTKEKITGFFSVFKPTEGYFITPILINLNILIFIVMVLSGVHFLTPDGESILKWGANFRPVTIDGQWWRLLSSCFLHIGIMHLLMNAYALLYVGLLLEPFLGKSRFLAAYLLSGIAGSLASLWYNEMTISAGASGAIFGLYGVFMALLTTNLLNKGVKKALTTSIMIFVGYNLLSGFQADSGVDNAAHIGGLLSGLVIGYAFIPSLKNYQNQSLKTFSIGSLAIALIISVVSVIKTIPSDMGEYFRTMETFALMEEHAMTFFKIQENSMPSDAELLKTLDDGLSTWHEAAKTIQNCNDLELPDEVKTRNERLIEYCHLRIKSYELISKAIDENTASYDDQIMDTNQELENILRELSEN